MKLKRFACALAASSLLASGVCNKANAFIKAKRLIDENRISNLLKNNKTRIEPQFINIKGDYYYKYKGKLFRVLNDNVMQELGCENKKPVLSAYDEHVYIMFEGGEYLYYTDIEKDVKVAVSLNKVFELDGVESSKSASIIATANGVFFTYNKSSSVYYVSENDLDDGNIEVILLTDYLVPNKSLETVLIEPVNLEMNMIIIKSPQLKYELIMRETDVVNKLPNTYLY